MKIGVGVEGPSDRIFWDKVLHKHFPGVRFIIWKMNGRSGLIRETSRMVAAFRDAGCSATFILVDRNDTLCVRAVIDEFDESCRSAACIPPVDRYVHICVAIREFEAWLLADGDAISAVLPEIQYDVPEDTGSINAERTLKQLWRSRHKQSAFSKVEFAMGMAPNFSPDRAKQHSASFSYFWERLTSKLK